MARLFIALELDKLGDAFVSMQERLRGLGKMTFPKKWHLTLKFLGDVPDKNIALIKDRLSSVEARAFDIELDQIGVFPDLKKVRVVWTSIQDSGEALSLHKKIDDVLSEMFEKDKDFVAHITLARVRYVDDKDQLLKVIESIAVPKRALRIDGFSLIQSTLTPQGPVYEELARFALEEKER